MQRERGRETDRQTDRQAGRQRHVLSAIDVPLSLLINHGSLVTN